MPNSLFNKAEIEERSALVLVHEYDMSRFVEYGLRFLGELLGEGVWENNPTNFVAGFQSLYECDEFMIKSWNGEDDVLFHHKPTNFVCSWCKSLEHSSTQNKRLTAFEWFEIFHECYVWIINYQNENDGYDMECRPVL